MNSNDALNRGRSESEKVSSMSPVCTVPLGPCYATSIALPGRLTPFRCHLVHDRDRRACRRRSRCWRSLCPLVTLAVQEWTTSDPTNFDRYERIAPFYDLLDLPFEYALYRRIRVMLFHDLSGCLLDAGVGTGRNIPFYPPGSHVVGIDFSPAMLARAKRKADRSTASIELRQMNIASPDFPDSTFDAAVASFLFCVLPDALQVPALRALGRVVKPGGVIRLLNYVRPRGVVRGVIAKLWQPCVARAFGASFDRQTENAIPEASLLLLDSRYVVRDLIKLVVARVEK